MVLYSPYIGIKDAGGAGATVTASGVFSAGVSTFGNTAGTTGVVTGENVFVGGSNITLSQSSVGGSATITIIGPNPGTASAAAFTGGVLGGDTVSGQILFTPGPNISFQSSTNAGSMTIEIDGPAIPSIGNQSLGISTIGNTAGTSGMVGGSVVRYVFVGGSNITLSQSTNFSSGTLTIIGPPEGTISIGMSNLGNTSGTTGVVTGSGPLYYFAGGNNITLSQSLNGSSGTLTIIGEAGGTGAGSFLAGQTTLGNSSGDVTVVSDQLVLIGGNKITLSGSTNGGSMSLTISGANAAMLGVSSGGNTAGTTGTVDAQVVFVGGSNVTLSQSINGQSATVTINGASGASGAGYTAGISTGGNTSGDATVVTGRLVLAGGNNITLSGSTNAGSITVTISAPSGGGAGVSSGGNTAGTTGTVDTQIIFVGGSNVTLSQSINGGSATVTINGASGGTGGVPIATAVKSVQSANSVGTITRYAPEDHQHAGVFAFGVSTGGNTLGSTTVFPGGFVLVGSNNITLSQSTAAGNNATITISGPTGGGAGMSTLGNTAGTTGTVGAELVFVGGSNISLSQSINGASATLTINGATAAGASFSAGLSNIGATSGDTGVVTNRLVLAGGSNITLSGSTNGGSMTITISGDLDIDGITIGGNTAGVGAIISSGTLNLMGGNRITMSQNGNSLTISGAADGLAAASLIGNTSGVLSNVSTGTLFLGGGNAITLSQNGNSVTISGAAEHSNVIGMSNLGNSSGTTGVLSAQAWNYFFAGSNNITLSQSINASSATLTILGVTSASLVPADVVSSVSTANASGTQHSWFARGDHVHAGVGPAGVSTGGNTAGTTTVAHGQLVFAGGANITLSQSADASNRMTVSVVGGAGGGTVSQWMPRGLGASSYTQMGQSTLALFPAAAEGAISISRADVFGSVSVSTSSNSSHQGTLSLHVGIYTRNVSTMSLGSSGSASYTWNVTGTTSSGSLVGLRNFTVPINANLTPGDYFIGVISQTATANANWITISNLGLVAFPNAFSGQFGGATNASNQFQAGLGIFTAQTAALPASVAFSGLAATSASTARPVINFLNYTA